jgi:hypothetical protein
VRGAEHQKGATKSESDPDARVLTVDARAADPNKTFSGQFATQSKRSAKPHTRKVGISYRARDLSWVLILYLITFFGVVIGTIVYLLS